MSSECGYRAHADGIHRAASGSARLRQLEGRGDAA